MGVVCWLNVKKCRLLRSCCGRIKGTVRDGGGGGEKA